MVINIASLLTVYLPLPTLQRYVYTCSTPKDFLKRRDLDFTGGFPLCKTGFKNRFMGVEIKLGLKLG
jgi:hypothetical protein